MKQKLLLALILSTLNIFGQNSDNKIPWLTILGSESDTTISVEYWKKISFKPNTKFFLDNVPVNEHILRDLEHGLVGNIVVNGDLVYVTTKNDSQHKPITLTALKNKRTNLADTAAVLFMVHGRIINEDYDKYVVNEKLFSKVIVEPMDRTNKASNITVIYLLTREESKIWISQHMIIR